VTSQLNRIVASQRAADLRNSAEHSQTRTRERFGQAQRRDATSATARRSRLIGRLARRVTDGGFASEMAANTQPQSTRLKAPQPQPSHGHERLC